MVGQVRHLYQEFGVVVSVGCVGVALDDGLGWKILSPADRCDYIGVGHPSDPTNLERRLAERPTALGRVCMEHGVLGWIDNHVGECSGAYFWSLLVSDCGPENGVRWDGGLVLSAVELDQDPVQLEPWLNSIGYPGPQCDVHAAYRHWPLDRYKSC